MKKINLDEVELMPAGATSKSNRKVIYLHDRITTMITMWLETVGPGYPRKTFGKAVGAALHQIGTDRLDRITAKDVACFVQSMQRLKPATVRLRLRALRSFFRFALFRRWVEHDPTADLQIQRVERRKRRTMISY